MLGPPPKFENEVKEFVALHEAFLPTGFRDWASSYSTMAEMWEGLTNPHWSLVVISQINHENYDYALLQFIAGCFDRLALYTRRADIVLKAKNIVLTFAEGMISHAQLSQATQTFQREVLRFKDLAEVDECCFGACVNVLTWLSVGPAAAAPITYESVMKITREFWPVFQYQNNIFTNESLDKIKKLVGNPFARPTLTLEGNWLY